MGREQSLRLNITISSGGGTGTLTKQWDICRWFRVIPVSESDSFDVTIKDADGHIMFYVTGNTGTLSTRLEQSLGIMQTVVIANASQDGVFVVKLDMH